MASPSRRDLLRATGLGLAAIAGCAGREAPPNDTTMHTATETRHTETTTQTTTDTMSETATSAPRDCVPESIPENGWPLPDRGPTGANYAPAATGPTEKPTVRWKRTVEEPETEGYLDVALTSPVVTADRIFVGKALYPGTENEMPDENAVHAYDRETGELDWSHPTKATVPESVAVMGEAVYVVTAGSVRAVERRGGVERWRFDPERGVQAATPTDGRIYVSTDSGSVVALRTDGSVAWTASVGDWVGTRPAVHDGTVFVGTGDSRLTALRTDDGGERWSVQLVTSESNAREVPGDVAVTDCGVFATPHGGVVALDFDGRVRWRATGGQYVLSTDGETVYTGTESGRLIALSAADGAVRWRTLLGEGSDQKVEDVSSDPVVADGTLYCSTRPGSLHSLDADTRTENWNLEFDSSSEPEKPAAVDDELFVSVGPSLVALE
ncbi:PQQ-binding-like beta-propeller repeat protein [Halorussus gelatinilyticus]|uniref:PQQ-binding-like beta-propeller repeat protein n=1 Tax=Halorussus gelatinilyticus TaxID=2937524 RepID=A0A8U0IIU1_9EURY|nr:PQQ-binding-like beta-propeller repeat protein [Halorussus gelatinilyticus]UPW00192.1 PQQ-binding-like beta-propeller repeat protein [Halorussus gelatinilyticus]